MVKGFSLTLCICLPELFICSVKVLLCIPFSLADVVVLVFLRISDALKDPPPPPVTVQAQRAALALADRLAVPGQYHPACPST